MSKPVKAGDVVIIPKIPAKLLKNLPEQDQHDILAIEGKLVTVVAVTDTEAEIEFIDDDGGIHWIWVKHTDCLKG